MTPNRRCDSCSSGYEENQVLFCRANPPQVTIIAMPVRTLAGDVVPQFQTLASQPTVKPEGWCMKWAPTLRFSQ